MEIRPVLIPVSKEPSVLDNPISFLPPEQPAAHVQIDNKYDVVSLDTMKPSLRASEAGLDLPFYQTKETLSDPETYRNFIKNAESRFRRSKEYTAYKAYLMSMGFDHCQIMGNIESEQGVDIELHHNILNLFDDCIMICEHVLNTVGYISTFDLIQLIINEHFANRIPLCFLSTTAHQMFTDDMDAYIPPNMTFGKWWELISKYRYGITFDIANKINRYISKYQNNMPTTVQIIPQEQILSFAYYNEYGTPFDKSAMEPYHFVPNTNQISGIQQQYFFQ